MKDGIRLHPKYGLNPTMPVCVYCGRERGDLALLGNSYKGEAPRSMVIDREPCGECLKKMEDESDPYLGFFADCGHSGLVRRSMLEKVLLPEAYASLEGKRTFRMEKCFHCLGMVKEEAKA